MTERSAPATRDAGEPVWTGRTGTGRPRVAVFPSSWGRPHDEAGFVARGVAGAASRVADVDVFVPGPPGPARPDGAFDVTPVGTPPDGPLDDDPWPADTTLGRGSADYDVAVVGEPTPRLTALLDRSLPGVPVAVVVPGGSDATRLPDAGADLPPGGALAVGIPAGGAETAGGTGTGTGVHAVHAVHAVGHLVSIGALAAQRRHVGMGFTGYVLVLSDRPGVPGGEPCGDRQPTPLAAWLIARFPRRVVAVVEDATATVWRSRSLLGRMTVDSRTDLWRLVAHASVTVDLAPGSLVARECVESLRYGVPIVVPAGGAGAALAAEGGGLWYGDVPELLGCVEAMEDPALRSTLAEQGRAVCDRWYGDTPGFVDRVGSALAAVASSRERSASRR